MVIKKPQEVRARPRFRGFFVIDNYSRMRFLESRSRRRVSRRENAVGPGLGPKFVVFFSPAIGTPDRAARPVFVESGHLRPPGSRLGTIAGRSPARCRDPPGPTSGPPLAEFIGNR